MTNPYPEFIGQRFGRLIVTAFAYTTTYHNPNRPGASYALHYYIVKCDCGKVRKVRRSQLLRTSGATRSCGCLKAELFQGSMQTIFNRKRLTTGDREHG